MHLLFRWYLAECMQKRNISALHLESAAHESLSAHCVLRAVARSRLRKECIWVYSGEVIESGSDGPLDSRRVSREKNKHRCNHSPCVLSFFLSQCGDYSWVQNQMTATHRDFYIFLENPICPKNERDKLEWATAPMTDCGDQPVDVGIHLRVWISHN